MRRPLLIPLATLLLWGCSDSTPPSVATTITVQPGSVSLNAIGATQVVHASVADQRGRAMANAALTWSSSSAAATVAGLGGDSALVTAAANGSASVAAHAGSAQGAATVQVTQAPAALQKSAGDLQTGAVGAALAVPLRVTVLDRLNAPAAGQTVVFAVAAGGGSLSVATAVTGPDGSATTTWTLGTNASAAQTVTATVAGVPAAVFTAMATAGAPAAAVVFSGNGQSGPAGSPLPLAPAVRVTDAFGNAVAGAVVNFLVTGGGGSVAGSAATTNPDGVAVLGSWTLGATPGANTLAATVAGTAIAPVLFTATGVAFVPGTVQAARGDNQGVMVGTAVPVGPAVVARDASGNPMPGLTVTFAVAGGGGTITGATAVTDASGVAAVGSWTVGATPGPNRLTATVQGVAITGSPVTFTAVGCSGGGGAGYAVTLCPITTMTPTQLAAFQAAATRWNGLVTGDLPNVSTVLAAGSCGSSPEVRFTIDDLVIFASIEPIDGPGQILGSAGWCFRRAAGLPMAGLMRFDDADVATLISRGQLDQVIVHEMGHVLGIGSLWSQFGLLQLPSTTVLPQDTWYSGAGGLTGFDDIGGATYTGGNKVPVENMGGAGTANAHWRESVLANELMTGFLNAGSNPLSELTVRSLADLGYTVNAAGADPFFLTLAVRGGQESPAGALKLGDDVWHGPRFTVDRAGRVTRIR